MTLNGVMAVTLCYLTEFGKPVFQHIIPSICGKIYAGVYRILYCVYTMSSWRKFTFAISSPDELFVTNSFSERFYTYASYRINVISEFTPQLLITDTGP